MSEKNIVESAVELAQDATAAMTLKGDDGREWLIVKDSYNATDVSDERGQTLKPPRYVQENVQIHTETALVDYINRYKTSRTMGFADVAKNKIMAVLDYHGRSSMAVPPAAEPVAAAVAEQRAEPDYASHSATLTLGLSEQWRAWMAMKDPRSQLDFARFLHEHMEDISEPAGADILEAVKSLTATRNMVVASDVNLATDHVNFAFQQKAEAHGKGGAAELPTQFSLSIPVYYGSPEVPMIAYLRWREQNGALQLSLAFKNAEQVRQQAFESATEAVRYHTDVLIVAGSMLSGD